MGEEGFEFGIGNLILKSSDGKEVKWDGLSTATLVPEETDVTGSCIDGEENKVYATLKNTESFEFECEARISRKSLLLFLVGDNKRMIRRALRWYEKLRRMELKGKAKFGNRLGLAAQYARFKENNRKHKTPHIYTYWFRMEREDVG